MSAGEPIRAELPDDLAHRAAEQLLEVDRPQRSERLEALIAAHPRHAAGLRRLLEDLDSAEDLLDGTYPDRTAATATHIGGHRVVRTLGEGAFGIVFLCAQERPVARNVAVKVLRPGAGDEQTLRRFDAERQLLASLNHPAITQVFDAGALPDGRPFFVMEYVDGVSIRRYCERHALSCHDRLRLLVDVCRGVAHAHNRGIVHRDLKPGNVLVVDTEAGPMPKIIDFGIAKALHTAPSGDGPRTEAGRVIGTPGYMSPEQSSGSADAADERADVFALGVMLYELLTGELPWLQGAAATDAEPVRPSARVTTAAGSRPAGASTQRRQLAAALRGDLDWITLKALARERDDRYATATALAADLERHLRGEPVSAGPPSTLYRLRKYVRRNRAVVAALGGAAVIVAAGLAAALAYGSAADTAVAGARNEAAASFERATAIVDQLLTRANDARLREAPRGDGARQALLQDALSFYDRFLQDRPTDPVLRAGRCRALLSISQVHALLGELTRARESAAEAAGEAEALLAAEPDNLAHRGLLGEALLGQGRALTMADNFAAARPKLAAAVQQLAACAAQAPARYGRGHVAAALLAAGTLEPHRADERLAGLRAGLGLLEALRASQPQIKELADDHVNACLELARGLLAARRFDEADPILTMAEADLPRVTSGRVRVTYQLHNLRASSCWERRERPGNREAALAHWQAAVDAAAAWQQEQPHRIQPQDSLAGALRNLGFVQNYTGAFDAASASFRSAIERAEAMVQEFPDDPSRLAFLCNAQSQFARILWDRFRQADLEEAAACAARATAVDARIDAAVDANRAPRWLLLGLQASIEDSRGHGADLWQAVDTELGAEPEARRSLEQDQLIETLTGLARWHFAHGRNEAAAARLAAARDRIESARPLFDKRMVEVGWLEARLAAARGDAAAAAAAADRVLAARPTWFGSRRAADCLHLAWRCAAAAGSDAAAGYRDRAAGLYASVVESLRDDVAANPQDPWFVLPWGFASIRAVELAGATGSDADPAALAAALAALESVRPASHADQWDAEVVRDGSDLQARLAEAARRR